MPVQTTRPRAAHLAAGATAVLALVLTGCAGGADAIPSAGVTDSAAASPASSAGHAASPSASSGVSSTTPAASSATAWSPGAAGKLPPAQLEEGTYEGQPRRLEEVFHLECLNALDGEDLPEGEDAVPDEGEKPVWSVHGHQALTPGWKACPTRMYEQIVIPATFTVTAEATDGRISRLRVSDAAGQVVGGFQDDVTGGSPEAAELVEAIEVTMLPGSPAADGEVRYLRTLVVDTGSGPQLLIDQVSAPAGTDPGSLEVWDLAAGPGERDLVYASLRLESSDDGRPAANSDLADVLRSMVGSFTPAVM